jgi:hypothetical protein
MLRTKPEQLRSAWSVWRRTHCDFQDAIARVELFGAKLLCCERLAAWYAAAQTSVQVWRRKYHICISVCGLKLLVYEALSY